MTTTRTRRVGDGVYELPDGSKVRHAWVERDGISVQRGWNLINPEGDWVQTFWLKSEAIHAWEVTV
jgi:hypothetical protein